MDGHLTDLGNGKYRCRVSFVDNLGNRVQKSKTFKASGKKEARDIMRDFRAECVKNTEPQTLMTLQDLYNNFVEYHGRDVQSATMSFYNDIWKKLKDHYKTSLDIIKPNTIRAMLEIAPANSRTRKGIYQLLSAMFNYALHSDLIIYNPCVNVKTPQYKAPKKKTLSKEQKNTLKEAIAMHPPKYQVIYYLTLTLGFRREEVCSLKWSDIDFRNKRLCINRTAAVITGQGTVIKDEAKTERAKDYLPLTDRHIKVLKDYRTYSEYEKKTYGIQTDFLFYQKNGNVISLSAVSHWFSQLCAGLGIDGITFHSLRHTCATDLLQNGVDIATVAAILRDSVATVEATYVHSDETAKRKAIENLNND